MLKRTHRTHCPVFKAKMALAALHGDSTPADLAAVALASCVSRTCNYLHEEAADALYQEPRRFLRYADFAVQFH